MMRQLKRSDQGVTLIEMVVVIAILSGVLAMVMTVIIAAQKNVNGNSARLDQIQQGKVAMESMSKTLRTAVRPSQLNATCIGCRGMLAASSSTPTSTTRPILWGLVASATRSATQES